MCLASGCLLKRNGEPPRRFRLWQFAVRTLPPVQGGDTALPERIPAAVLAASGCFDN